MIRIAVLSLLTAVFLCSASLAMERPSPEPAYQAFREAEVLPSTVPAVPETPGLPAASVRAERVVTITGLMESASPQKQEILFLPVGGDPAMLVLPAALACVTDGEAEYGGSLIYSCPVSWDTAGLNTAEAGRTTIIGQLSPEEGYALAPDTDGKVTHPVVITASGMPEEMLESVEPDGASFSLMSLGGGPMEPDLTCTGAVCYAGEGAYFSCTVDWDLSAVDHAVPGVYPITGTPRLPEGFLLPEGKSGLTAEVGVVSSDYVDLSAPSINPEDNAYVFFSWLYQPKDRRSMVLQYSSDGSSWQDAPVDEYGVGRYGTILWNGMGLTLHLTQLEPYKPYRFRILYDEDQVSNTAELCVTDTDFTMTAGGKGGDRDGGDQPPASLPDYHQPAPSAEPSPSPAAGEEKLPLELNTESSASISGIRLQQLTNASDTVLFEKQGVAVELKSAFLAGLGLADHDLLTVEIRLSGTDTFTLDIRSSDKILTNLPPTVVRLPWAATEAPLRCCGQDGTIRSDACYHARSRTVSCVIFETGTYQITAALPKDTEAPLKPLDPVTVIPPAACQPAEEWGKSQAPFSDPATEEPLITNDPEKPPLALTQDAVVMPSLSAERNIAALYRPILVLMILTAGGVAAWLWRKKDHEG